MTWIAHIHRRQPEGYHECETLRAETPADLYAMMPTDGFTSAIIKQEGPILSNIDAVGGGHG